MKALFNFLFIPILIVSVCSCSERLSDETYTIEEQNSREVSIAGNFYNKIYEIARNEVEDAESEENISLNKTEEVSEYDPCALVSFHLDTAEGCITNLTVVFNDTTCNSWGRRKYGKLKVYLNGKLDEAGTVMTIIPEGFYLEGKRIEGTMKIVHHGFNTNLMYEVTREVTDGKIWLSSNMFFTWNSKEFAEIDLFNEEVFYEMEASVTSQFGRQYDVETLDPLKSDFECGYFQSGELQLSSNWGLNQRINYGDGSCDTKAFVFQGDDSIEIELD